MKVELLSYTPDAERIIASSVKACHSKDLSDPGVLNDDDIERLIKLVRTSGHWSVMEHASFTFAVSGVSRVLTHQLVRHRIASYSQQSQRYVNLKGGGYTTPQTLEDGEAAKVYDDHIESAFATYRKLIEMGIPKEDARYVLPNATTSNIIITMNARSLWNFFNLRTCRRAQKEIQVLAVSMLKEVQKVAPIVFEDAGPPCVRGPCPEGEHTCGRPMKKGQVE